MSSLAGSARRVGVITVAGLLALAGSACADDKDAGPVEGKSVLEGTTAPCTPPATIAPSEATAILPAGLELVAGSEVVKATKANDRVNVVARVSGRPSAIHEQYVAKVKEAGFTVLKTDDEGREAEVFFQLPDGTRGEIRQATVTCPPDTTQTIITTEPE